MGMRWKIRTKFITWSHRLVVAVHYIVDKNKIIDRMSMSIDVDHHRSVSTCRKFQSQIDSSFDLHSMCTYDYLLMLIFGLQFNKWKESCKQTKKERVCIYEEERERNTMNNLNYSGHNSLLCSIVNIEFHYQRFVFYCPPVRYQSRRLAIFAVSILVEIR